jgi:hypothetical protein
MAALGMTGFFGATEVAALQISPTFVSEFDWSQRARRDIIVLYYISK